jgi:hypothetical protein
VNPRSFHEKHNPECLPIPPSQDNNTGVLIMPKLNLKDYRLDYRTFEAFASKVQYHSQEETRYLIDWIANHNKTRHKRDFVILPWGCQSEIVRDSKLATDFYRKVCPSD